MKNLKKIQKNIASNSKNKPSLRVVHLYFKDGEPRLVASDGFKLLELTKVDLIIKENVKEKLPETFSFVREDVEKIKNFSGRMDIIDFDENRNILFYNTYAKDNASLVEINAMLRISTDHTFAENWESLFELEKTNVNEGMFNYKFIKGVGEILANEFDGMKFSFWKNNSSQVVMVVDGEKGRALIMTMDIGR